MYRTGRRQYLRRFARCKRPKICLCYSRTMVGVPAYIC